MKRREKRRVNAFTMNLWYSYIIIIKHICEKGVINIRLRYIIFQMEYFVYTW